jgi:hypothetical protein
MSEKDKKNEISLDDLAQMMTDGFEKSNKLTDEKIEALAILVQNQFVELKDEIKEVKSDLEDEIKAVKSNTEDIKAELNKKVNKITHNDLTYRVEKLEEKFA